MELYLDKCETFSPNIEAKCLAKNEKRAMDTLKQALDELEKAKHQMPENEYIKLFDQYTQAYQIIADKYVDEEHAINTHNQHEVYKTAEGKYVAKEQAETLNAVLVTEGINLIQNHAVLNARDLIYKGDDAITAAIRIAKLKGLREASNRKAQQEIDDANQEEQPVSFNDEILQDTVTIMGDVNEHHFTMYHN